MGHHQTGTFGATLRTLREHLGWTQARLAREVGYSEAAIGHLETGRRRPADVLAAMLDAALGTSPVLQLEARGELDMATRRAVLGYAGLVGATLGAFGLAALPDDIVSTVSRLVHADDDALEVTVTAYERRYLTNRSPKFAHDVTKELAALREIMRNTPTPARFRAAARLTQTLALVTADSGDIPAAHGLAQSAINLAVQSGDTAIEACARGRLAARGVYEGWSVRAAREAAHATLAMSPGATLGALEAHAAFVHIAGLTGDYRSGVMAVHDMNDVAEALPAEADPHGIAPLRAALFGAYIAGKLSPDLGVAERAYDHAKQLTRGVPAWLADATIYFGMAQVRAGYAEAAVPAVLRAVRDSPAVYLLGVGVLDFLGECAQYAQGYHSDELDELATLVPAGTVGPWATLRP